jgi:2-oxoisovalerate dehydrogenase E1 component beta subunit
MTTMTMLGAITDAMATEMRNDDRVVVFGEDVGKKGGVFGTTAGLQEEFGETRCFDTPLSECGIIGTGIGMAVYGMRPVAEIQFLDFIYPAFDQIVSEAAKMRYRSGGEYTCPMVIHRPTAAVSVVAIITANPVKPTSVTRQGSKS